MVRVVGEDLMRPGPAAARLGIAANTLRLYSVRFAACLSGTASAPRSAGGGVGHRLYSAGDLAVLKRARELLASGLTYEEALARIRGEGAGAHSSRRPRTAPPLTGQRPEEPGANLVALQEAVDAWRALAEERGREAADLRQQVRGLEQLVADLDRRLRDGPDQAGSLAPEGQPHDPPSVSQPAGSAEGFAGGGSRPQRSQSGWWSRLFPAGSEPRSDRET